MSIRICDRKTRGQPKSIDQINIVTTMDECQGCSLRLTGTRGLVEEGGVEGVLNAFGG